jgi:hypothetical protein
MAEKMYGSNNTIVLMAVGQDRKKNRKSNTERERYKGEKLKENCTQREKKEETRRKGKTI